MAYCLYFDGLVQERRNSIANALELRLSGTNPWIFRISPVYVIIILIFWPAMFQDILFCKRTIFTLFPNIDFREYPHKSNL